MFDDLGASFGSRVRELREEIGATQDQLARAVKRTGAASWTTARVGQVEHGSIQPDLVTAYAVARALRELSGEDVRLADLLPASDTSEEVQLLRAALAGDEVRGPRIAPLWDYSLTPGWGPVEDRVLANFGEGFGATILETARRLYHGRTGTEERDLRAGPDAKPQRRGAMGRALVKELIAAIDAEVAEENLREAAEMGEGRDG